MPEIRTYFNIYGCLFQEYGSTDELIAVTLSFVVRNYLEQTKLLENICVHSAFDCIFIDIILCMMEIVGEIDAILVIKHHKL